MEIQLNEKKQTWSRIVRIFFDFKAAFVAIFYFTILGLITLCLNIWFPMVEYLAASINTPWGILTSLLVHKDWLHFGQNTASLIILTFLFATINMHLEEQEKHSRLIFFLWNILFSAILANILWVIILPQVKSIGSSGVVYALTGVVMAFSLNNACSSVEMLRGNHKESGSLKDILNLKKNPQIVCNSLVFSSLLICIIIDPKGFLSAGPQVNTFVHFIAFSVSFLMAVILHPQKRDKIMLKFSCFNCNHVMPKRETAEDLVTRETSLLYYLWRNKGFRGTISALSKELNYKDDSTVNKRINRLKQMGYVKEEQTKAGTVFKITSKGERKIIFLILPRYTLSILLILTFGYVLWGLLGLLGLFHVEPWNMLLVGIISLCVTIILSWTYRRSEEELLRMIYPESDA
ncbi:MAG: rhomboid family intramembrane serine protease [Nitrososphaerota archaeon]